MVGLVAVQSNSRLLGLLPGTPAGAPQKINIGAHCHVKGLDQRSDRLVICADGVPVNYKEALTFRANQGSISTGILNAI